MNKSIFLARVLGLYMTIIALALFINPDYFTIFNGMINNLPLVILAGVISLVIGILLIVGHNIWVRDWRVVVTLVGWTVFLKGLVNTVFPNGVFSINHYIMTSNTAYYTSITVTLLIGLFLCYQGFFAKRHGFFN